MRQTLSIPLPPAACLQARWPQWLRRAAAAARAASRALALLGLAASSHLACGAPAAGSRLDNTASAHYFDTDSGFNATLHSNTVSITVQPLDALTLTADSAVQRAAGGQAALSHRLSNTGNGPSSYLLRFANRSDDDHDLTGLRLVWDKNGNGVADANEPEIASGALFGPLPSGGFADFVLLGGVADGVAVGKTARIDISARSQAQGALAANIDSVTVADGAMLQLRAALSNPSPAAGSTVTLALTASNTGNRAASGVPVTVDGLAMTLVLLRDSVPANTTLAAASPANGALALYHVQGQPDARYSRSPPADLRQVDAVAFGFAADVAPGQSLRSSLDLKVNANATGAITHSGRLWFMDGLQAQPVAADSNPVRMQVPEQAPLLRLFADALNTRPITALAAGQPFFVTFSAARCNLDPLRIETQLIAVASVLAGDTETFLATETGPNSGEFRIEPSVPTSDALKTPLVRGDGRLSVRPNDQLVVSVTGCGATLMQASVLVDPFGVVFDSKTNAPLAGAVVRLIDVTGAGNGGQPGGLAHVFLLDGLTRAPSVLSTAADGEYRFPLVAPSVYRLGVVAPADYTSPSALAASLLPPERVVDAAGSYGATFTITALSEPVHLDIPLDADARAGFFIEKTASRKSVELGEFVDYQIKVKNVSGQLLGRIRVQDQLPAGFAYLRGSARLDGTATRLDGSALPEPEGNVGPALVFNIGAVNDGAQRTLSYRVRVGPGALQGDGTNRAHATSAGPLAKRSNDSHSTVQVLPGVFGNRGFLLGQVYADCNHNQQRDDGEPGIAGVRLFLQDGSHVTTDRLGRYSLYGLKPLTHVIKLDRSTLPAGMGLGMDSDAESALSALANRHAGDAGSRFVDMKNGELQRADFALAGCTDVVLRAIAARAEAAARSDPDGDAAQGARLAADPRLPPVADAKALPASGRVGGARPPPAPGDGRNAAPGASAAPAATAAPAGADPSAPDSPAAATAPADLSDDALATLDNRPAILSPGDAQVLATAQTRVVVKGALGTQLTLRVNGVDLPATRIGRLRRVDAFNLQVADYVGVDLKPGLNTLELLQTPSVAAPGSASESHPATITGPAPDSPADVPPGLPLNLPASQRITLTAPGALAQLRLSAAPLGLPADGPSRVRIRIEPLDAAGLPVTSPTPVTLTASRGRWQVRDLDPAEPGLQIFVEGGLRVVELEAPAEPGDVQVQASSGDARAQLKLGFNAELRPLIAVGVVEGVLHLHRLAPGALQPARAQDGFEQALQTAASRFANGAGTAAGRSALFLKGKVLGDALLTLAYDSDKDSRDRLFRDIQPAEFYPVYGDDSEKGFDAQSTGRLYLRLDRGASFVLYGDFNTQADDRLAGADGSTGLAPDERRLGQYSRSLNGARAQLQSDDGRNRLTAFAAQTSSRQVIDELPALGSSGPYRVSRTPMLENSETVALLTRDRNQPSRVLRSVALARFVDYEIETLGGGILLRAPLASLDAGFNPNSVRVTYEVEAGGAKRWVAGAALRTEATAQLALSASLVRDDDAQHALRLQSAGAQWRLAPATALAVEAAHTESVLATAAGIATSGQAGRVVLRHDGERLKLLAQAVSASAGFDNPSAGITPGRQEISARASYQHPDGATWKAEAQRSDDRLTAAQHSGALLSVEQAWTDKVRAELAVRHGSGADLGAPAAAAPANPAASAAAAAATGAPAGTPTTTVLAKLTAQLPDSPNASVFAEVEQDIYHSGRHLAALGGQYRLNSSTRLYGRHELISSLGSRYGLTDGQQRNASVLGLQTEPVPDANLFSEYRVRDAVAGREAEAALGLRQRWKLGGGWSASAGFERVHSLAGNGPAAGSNEATSATGGVEYSGATDWRGTARLEWREAATSRSVLSTVGLAYKLGDAWTALGRNLLTVTRGRNGSGKTEDWLQVGLAYRETAQESAQQTVQETAPESPQASRPDSAANGLNALLRAEIRTEALADPAHADSGRRVAIVSAHAHQQLSATLALSGRAAAKWALDQSPGLRSRNQTGLLAGRLVWDIAPRWDTGLQASALVGAAGHSRQWGLGSELGYLLADNLWLSLGWNVFGFTDRDLTAQDNTQRGVYLRLRFKFDEALF